MTLVATNSTFVNIIVCSVGLMCVVLIILSMIVYSSCVETEWSVFL